MEGAVVTQAHIRAAHIQVPTPADPIIVFTAAGIHRVISVATQAHTQVGTPAVTVAITAADIIANIAVGDIVAGTTPIIAHIITVVTEVYTRAEHN